MIRPLALLLLASGCVSDGDRTPTDARDPAPPITDPPPTDTDLELDCDLVVTPEAPWVTPGGELRFEVHGGGGAPVFHLAENNSGAILDARTGAYLAGDTTDVQDLLEVVDPACPGVRVEIRVDVAPAVQIEPESAELHPGTVMVPTITGGSSEIRCSLSGADTGSTLDGCTYTAGPRTGDETLWVIDDRTGDRAAASLRVDPRASLRSPVTHWGGVVGEEVAVPLAGGSGHYELRLQSGQVELPGAGIIRATKPGSSVVRAVDRYVGLHLDLSFDTLDVVVPDHIEAHGERLDNGRLLGGHDLDGDGFEDLVRLDPEASVDSRLSGGAFVYAGSKAGLDVTPDWSIGGERTARLGYGGALGDFNGDGELDLALGSIYDDTLASQQGALTVHHGIAGGFFEDEASSWFSTGDREHRLGMAVGACDVDGDGYDDVLVSAYQGQDPDSDQAAPMQGVVYGVRGGPDGLESRATWVLPGRIPDDRGGWEAREDLHLGIDLVTGDIDDDGRCDVVVSARAGIRRESTYGSVFVYLGTETGLPEHADVMLDHDDSGDLDGRFGRRLALHNLDGKGGDDLIVGGDGIDAGGQTASGTVVLYDSETLLSADGVLSPDDAVWHADGGMRWDRLGWHVSTMDLDADGIDELLVGAHSDEITDGARDSGMVYVWNGGDLRADLRRGVSAARSPSLAFAIDHAYARLGTMVTGADIDGDGTREVLASATRDSEDHQWGGALYVIDSARDYTRLGYARTPHLTYMGLGLAWTEDHTGAPSLLIGAPYALSAGDRYRGGRVWAAPRADVQDTGDRLPLLSHNRDYDATGWSVDSGDFDGDGRPERVVLSRMANRPGSFDASRIQNPTACPGSASNAGAVQVVRPGAERAAAVFYAEANDRVDRVHAGSDLNGDGYDDLVVVTRQDTARQGIWVVWGRSLSGDKTTVLCEATRLSARESGSQLGISMVGLGDLDGDGCDEVALGANSDDRGRTNQGAVRILRGWGGARCAAMPRTTEIIADVGSANLGSAVAAGDLNGDGISELVVSATNQRGDDGERGVITVLDGAALGRMSAWPASGERLPSSPVVALSRLAPLATIRASADRPALGWGLAVAPGRTPMLFVSSRASDLAGGHGAVLGYTWTGDDLVLDRIIVGPPAPATASSFGDRIAVRPGSSDLAISAFRADGIGFEVGEVYVWAP